MSPSAHPSRALRALRRGEISLRVYLTARVQRALAPLAGRLTPQQLRQVAAVLEARLKVDPLLKRYVQRLTSRDVTASPPSSDPSSVK